MTDAHICPPGRLYVCPSAREVESSCHGGHDVCCDRPDLHVPIPDGPGAEALSTALSEAAKREYARATVVRQRDALERQLGPVRDVLRHWRDRPWANTGPAPELYEALAMTRIDGPDDGWPADDEPL